MHLKNARPVKRLNKKSAPASPEQRVGKEAWPLSLRIMDTFIQLIDGGEETLGQRKKSYEPPVPQPIIVALVNVDGMRSS